MDDGLYFIQSYMVGLPISQGIGVGHSGVLHVPYHVCHGQVVHIRHTVVSP